MTVCIVSADGIDKEEVGNLKDQIRKSFSDPSFPIVTNYPVCIEYFNVPEKKKKKKKK